MLINMALITVACVVYSGVAKGELDESKAGWYTSLARRAKNLGAQYDSNNIAPTIVIETQDRNILMKEYDSMTIVVKSTRNDD